jgi:large subunit ribosomal protein L25
MSVVQTEPREGRSSSLARQLRRAGFLPMAIVHSKGEPELIKAKASDVKKALHDTPGVGIFQIQMAEDKQPRTVLVKHVDFEPVTKAIIHMTLQEVKKGDTIQLSVPLKPVGENRIVAHGGAVLMRPNHHVRIKCHVSEAPSELEYDITEMKDDESVTAGMIALPKGVELVSDPEDVVFFMKPVSKVDLELEGEEAATEIPDEAVKEGETASE